MHCAIVYTFIYIWDFLWQTGLVEINFKITSTSNRHIPWSWLKLSNSYFHYITLCNIFLFSKIHFGVLHKLHDIITISNTVMIGIYCIFSETIIVFSCNILTRTCTLMQNAWQWNIFWASMLPTWSDVSLATLSN